MFAQIHTLLLEWYQQEGRHELPWRNTTNIYHIYLSEIMLQQTQVNRVRDEYYPQFLKKFPSLQALASASQDEVLAAWSGLGYYSRARNLHKCAKSVAGVFPQTEQELLKLPGIGRYTASAICSFGYKQSVAVVDTNIGRVIKRYFALFNPSERLLWSSALELLNRKMPREHNLALMDLGSLICLPKNPKCDLCPLNISCRGKENPELYTQTKKKSYESLELFYGVLIKENKIALKVSKERLYKEMLVLPEVDPLEEFYIGSFKHSYTKYRLSVNLYSVEEVNGEIVWIDIDKLEDAPISTLVKKAKHFLNIHAHFKIKIGII